jgi:hypothetical protein
VVGTSSEGKYEETGMKTIQEHFTSAWKAAESDTETTDVARREIEDETKKECLAATVAPKTEGKLLVSLQVNCRSIYKNTLDIWNLTDTCNPDVVIGTESRLSEEISNADVFRGDYTTSRRDRHTRGGGGVFICVNNYTTCAELWVDDVHEMIAVEVKGRGSKITWENVGIYRAPNEDTWLLEKLADRTGYMGRTTKRSIIRGDLNLSYADWDGHAEKSKEIQVFLITLVWETSRVYKVFSGVNSHHGRIMVVAWSKFGHVLRK